ncbi:hypothetical protein C2I36_15970 [Rhodobacteraceae bacterium WD3A24]|nr:hypothetical protein C2I36_15970 [Rhodobacteraceae bacterium WD3A24]
MGYVTHDLTLGDGVLTHGVGIAALEVRWIENEPYVFAGAFSDGGITRLSLASGRAEPEQEIFGTDRAGTTGLTDMAFVEVGGYDFLLAPGRHAEALALRVLRDDGSIGGLRDLDAPAPEMLRGWSQTTGFNAWGKDFLVAARWDAPGLRIFEVGADYRLDPVARLEDGPKSPLGEVSALTTLELGGARYLAAASSAGSAVTTFRLEPGGAALVDTIGAPVGVGWQGTQAMSAVEIAGTQFLVVGSTGTGTMSTLRINDHGVMFLADTALDDRTTRFDALVDLATFEHRGRSFVVAGGGDDGLSLFEIGPDGAFYHLETIAHRAGLALADVAALGAGVVDDVARIFTASDTEAGVSQFGVDMARFGELRLAGPGEDRLTGTGRDDHLQGGDGAVTLDGGGGADRLVAGDGATEMRGGAGADAFVFRPDSGSARIFDFEHGLDRLDLSAYPLLYSPDRLTITATDDGARIEAGDDVIDLHSADGRPLAPEDFDVDDFIFG